MLVFIKALLIFLLIKHHYTTHSSNLMEHTWTNARPAESRKEAENRGRMRRWETVVSGSGLTGGGTEPLGGSVALHGTAWLFASLQWNAREEKKGVKPMLVFLVKYSCLMMQRQHRED